ncbi:MAG: hypothetical protein ACRDFX_01550 [Chloroflexota bacterium]
MGMLTGVIGAGAAAAAIYTLLQITTGNLAVLVRQSLIIGLVGLALLVGLLVGAAIGRRARRDHFHLRLFAGIASAVGGGIIGSGFAVAITAAYLNTYAQWPDTLKGQMLYALAYPAFGAVGWFAGAAVGLVFGLVVGTVYCVVVPAR